MTCAKAEIALMLELVIKHLCRECPECCRRITNLLEPLKEIGMAELRVRLGL